MPLTLEQRLALASDLDALPPGSTIPDHLADYEVLRAQSYACMEAMQR